MRVARWLAVSALWMGCGSSQTTVHEDAAVGNARSAVSGDNCLPLPCPSNAPWNSATCKCERSCDFEGEITRRVGSGDFTDCGSISVEAGPAALRAAQKCALDAQGARTPFKLQVTTPGIDSTQDNVFVSDGAHSSLIRRYDDIGGEWIAGELCTSLVVEPNCQIANAELCLRCGGQLESSRECTTRQVGACNRVGDYQAGKEGSQPCCPGLREVFHASQNSDGTCLDLPLRVSSCIEGRCGDGRCEEQERNPCGGCTLDCQ